MEKTYTVKKVEIKREWHQLDATDQVLGRLATRAAQLLMGKHKPTFTRSVDMGDYVVIINADKIKLTGSIDNKKTYYHHTMYPGGMKTTSTEKLFLEKPVRLVQYAVKGMLPHTKLGDAQRVRLKVFEGEEHPYKGQIKKAPVATEASAK